MYEILAAATTVRIVTVPDLNIPDPPEGADPQSAVRLKLMRPATVVSPTILSNLAAPDVAIASLNREPIASFNSWR
jgi:hypothetical protein